MTPAAPVPTAPVVRVRPALGAAIVLAVAFGALDLFLIVKAITSATTRAEWAATAPGLIVLLAVVMIIAHVMIIYAFTDLVVRGPGWTEHSVFGRTPLRIEDDDLQSISTIGFSLLFRSGRGKKFSTRFVFGDRTRLFAAYVDLVRRRPQIAQDPGVVATFVRLGVTELAGPRR